MINHLVIRFIQIAKQSFVFFVKFVVCAYTPPAVYEQRIYRILNEQVINHLVIRFIQIAKQSFVFFVKFVVCAYTPPAVYEQRIYRILNEQVINHLVIRFIQIAKQSFVFFVKFVVCITLFIVIVQSELLHYIYVRAYFNCNNCNN